MEGLNICPVPPREGGSAGCAADNMAMTTRRLFLAACFALTAATSTPAVAGAADPVWQPSMRASEGAGTAAWPKVAATPDGAVAVVWAQMDGGDLRMAGKTRSASGVWSPTEFISPENESTGHPTGYLLTGAGDGSFSVAWMRGDYQARYLLIKQPGEDWTTPGGLTPESGEQFSGGYLAAGPDDSTVMFTSGDISGEHKMRVFQRPAGSDTFAVTSEFSVSNDDAQGSPVIAYNRDGNAVAAWRSHNTGNTDDVYAARYNGHAWDDETLVHATGLNDIQAISAAIDDDGAAAIVWGGPTQVNAWITGQTGPTAAWHTPHPMQTAGPNLVMAQVAADQEGNFVTVYQEYDANDVYSLPAARARTYRPSDDSLSDFQELTTAGGAPSLAANANGDMVVSVMGLGEDSTPQLRAAYRPSGSTAFPATGLVADQDIIGGQYEGVATAAIDDNGNTFIGFPQIQYPNTVVSVVGGDGAAPTLGSVSVPTTADAGDPVSFSSSAFDLWSGLGTTTWDFGDGTTETGTSVEHVYAAGGTFTVRVTTSDLAGFDATESRTISVTPPPAPPEEKPKPPVLAPVIEARLAGKTITFNAKVTLRAGKKCTGKVTATTSFGKTTYRTTLKLRKVNGTCVGTGTIKLKKAPSTRTKLRVTVSAKTIKTRTLTTKRA